MLSLVLPPSLGRSPLYLAIYSEPCLSRRAFLSTGCACRRRLRAGRATGNGGRRHSRGRCRPRRGGPGCEAGSAVAGRAGAARGRAALPAAHGGQDPDVRLAWGLPLSSALPPTEGAGPESEQITQDVSEPVFPPARLVGALSAQGEPLTHFGPRNQVLGGGSLPHAVTCSRTPRGPAAAPAFSLPGRSQP